MPITNNTVNAVAMTVLSDAPVDPVTGLKVPTIAVATGGGVSVLKHDGTVTSKAWSPASIHSIAINKTRIYTSGGSSSSFWGNMVWDYVSDMSANYGDGSNSSRIPFVAYNSTGPVRAADKAVLASTNTLTRGGPRGVAILRDSPGASSRSLVAQISSVHHTGFLTGDIKRCYLADIGAGSMTGPELVTNGDFSNGLTGWTPYPSEPHAVVSDGAVRISDIAGQDGGVRTPTAVIAGRRYELTFDVLESNGTYHANMNNGLLGVAFSGIGKKRISWVTTHSNEPLSFFQSTADTSTLLTNISIREVIADRSYKANGASITGTLTKTEVASAAQLVAYSGFSAANYLQEPYSADLDFGVGEWSVSGWVNVPVTLPLESFPINGPELVTNGDFSSGSTGWAITETLGSWSISAGALSSSAPAGAIGNMGCANAVPTVIGTTVEIMFDIVATAGVSGIYYRLGGAGAYVSLPTTTGTKTVLATVTGNSGFLEFRKGDRAASITLDNISVREMASAPIADRAFSSGAKLNLGTNAAGRLTATAFDGTTTRTVMTSAAYNTATWLKAEACYTTDGTLAILVNGVQVAATRGNPLLNLNSRYNLFSYSQEFDNAAWSKSNVTITANAATAPDGAVTADRLITNSGSNSLWYLQQIPSGLVGSLSYSIYAKADSATHIGFDTSNSGPMAGVNLSTGAISLNGLGISVSAQADGWYRITLNTTGDRLRVFCSTTEITSGNQAVTGDGVSGVLIWGAQVTPSALAALPYQRVGAATDFDFAAPLTIGNSFSLDAPFPGSIALLKLSATVPTAEQAVWMYEQEKHLFQAGAQCCLPDAGAIADLTYDEATDKWIAISATNESEWSGLVRTSVTAVPAGSYTRAVAGGGVQLLARNTTTPGVDVTIPAYGLREELVKRAEAAARLNAQTALYDFVGGFTATTTSGSTSITSAASLTYPVSYVGARVTGSGIPADTFVAAVVGTTVYLTKAATASASAVQISFTDFILPVGYEAKVVLAGGANKVEGATKDFTRLFDGFKETIRFGTAPGHTAAIQIQATRSAA